MKHIIWLLSLFIFSNLHTLSAQNPTSVVLVSKGPKVSPVLSRLPIAKSLVVRHAMLPLPIYKLPVSFDKKYIIRVHQSDTAIFQKFIPNLSIGLLYHRGFDHKGYDYFLPLAFHKEKDAESYLAQLKDPVFNQAVVVKKVPKNVSCNCFKRF